MSMLCGQCHAPAERCDRCSSALGTRRLCAEPHEASCAAMSTLPREPLLVLASAYKPKVRRRERNEAAERIIAEQLVAQVTRHRQAGRAALLVGDLDAAFDELWAARQLEPD